MTRTAAAAATILAVVGLAAPAAQGGTRTINFDDATGPCNFVNAGGPLTTEYQSGGITFAGPSSGEGGARLNQCSGFGVSGHSVPNFLGFNTGAQYPPSGSGKFARGPETITFATPANSVSAKVGGAAGTATLTAFNGTTPVAQSSVPTASALAPLQVAATRITSARVSYTGSTFVIDDLTWGSNPIGAPDSYSSQGSLNVPPPGVLGNDSDPDGDGLTATLVRTPSKGTVVLGTSGSFTYQPNSGTSGTDTFEYAASSDGTASDPVTVTVQVFAPAVNQAPIASLSVARQKLRTALARGLSATFRTNEASTAALEVFGDSKLLARSVRVARGTKRAARPGRYRAVAKFTRAAKRKLARKRSVRLTVRLTVTDGGGKRVRKNKRVVLRR